MDQGIVDKTMMDEFVALYVGMKDKALEQAFREKLSQPQSEGAQHFGKSGSQADTFQYAVKSMQAFFKSNDLVASANAAETAIYNNVYKGNRAQDYSESFRLMKEFVDQSLDEVKGELQRVVFPIFVCLFLNMMLKKQFKDEALQFFQQNKQEFGQEFRNDIQLLETVYDVSRLEDPEISKYLRRKFFVKISRQAYTLLKYQVDFNQLYLILHIMNLNIQFEISSEQDIVFEKNKVSSVLVADSEDSGLGQLKEELNLGRIKEFYAESWEKAVPVEEGQANLEQAPKKKKNFNLIQAEIPMPQLDQDLIEDIQAEFGQQVKLQGNALPSIGTIALLFSYRQVNATCLSDSGELMACGLADSTVKVFWLNEAKVKEHAGLGVNDSGRYLGTQGMKVQLYADVLNGKGTSLQKARQNILLKQIDKGVLDLRPEQEEAKVVKELSECILIGHSGPVFCCSISVDDRYLITGSIDCTVRRWSLQTRSCVVVYHGHQLPVWDVKFCPLGYYFASASNDRTACVWNMKQHTPVRILPGHMSDVTCVEFHPNIHYLATGSSDNQVRLWAMQTGEIVRTMFTVAGAVRSLKFTRAGTHLLAGNEYGQVVFFDLVLGVALDIIQTCQQRAVWSIDVSWDDSLIAIGTELSSIELYSLKILLKQTKKPEEQRPTLPTKNSLQRSPSPAFLKCYHTKMNGVLVAQFSWRNFLTTIGCVEKAFN